MQNRVCDMCGCEFTPKVFTQKRCSEKCQKEGFRKYMRDYYRNKYHEDPEYRKKVYEKGQKWKKENMKKTNTYMRKYLKNWRREKFLAETDPKIIKFLKEIAKKQKSITLIRKTKCECCGDSENLVIHHISYSPVEIITLCSKCHSILHHCLLKRKKVKKIKDET